MKKLFFIMSCILLINTTDAKNYYVSYAEGDDSNSGFSTTEAWETLDKLNAEMTSGQIKSGDKIFFQRDNTFSGTLNVTVSGLTFNTYGSGAKPRLDGSTLLTNWQQITGTNKWTTTCGNCGDDIRSLSINDEFQRFARYPNYDAANGGYLTFESSNIQTVSSNEKYTLSITDNQLSNSPNWKDAEVVVRNRHWKLDKAIVSQHNGGTIVFDTKLKGQVTDNFGYFFQNDPQALDQIGEFTYDATSGEFQLVSSVNPNDDDFIVRTTSSPYVINISGQDNISLNNLQISGGLVRNVYMESVSQITFNNCKVNYGATDGIVAINSTNINILNSTIQDIQNNGIYLGPPTSRSDNHYDAHDVEIAHSTIRNIAMVAGMGQSQDGQYIGIRVIGDNTNIHHNNINNIGYSGIYFRGSNTLVTNNFIEYFCLVKDDGAGIYTYNNVTNPITFTNQQIKNNIVLNGTGAPEGANRDYGRADGIYIDDGSDNIIIQDNVCANNSESGVHIHHSGTQDIQNNLLFNNGTQLFLSQDNNDRQQIRGLVFENNCAISNTAEQKSIYAKSRNSDLEEFGSINNNYYSAYNSGEEFKYINYSTEYKYSLNNWQSERGYDINSEIVQEGPYTFHYNDSDDSVSIPLSGDYMDVKGNAYSGGIILAPWSGAVLTPDSPTCASFTQFNVNATTTESIALNWQQTNDDIQVFWRLESDVNSWQSANATTNSYTITGLNPDTQYRITLKNLCDNSTTTSQTATTLSPSPTYYYITNRQTGDRFYPESDAHEAPLRKANAGESGDLVQWEKIQTSNGYFYLKNKATGKFIRPQNDSDAATVWQVPTNYTGSYTQWEEVPVNNSGFYHLKNRATGKYIRPQNDTPDAPILQQPSSWTGSWTQWSIEPVNVPKLQTDDILFNLYPNPADDYIRIETQHIEENSSVSIYDISGKLVIHQAATSDTFDISVQDLKAGMYIARLDIGDGTYAAQRFVVQ